MSYIHLLAADRFLPSKATTLRPRQLYEMSRRRRAEFFRNNRQKGKSSAWASKGNAPSGRKSEREIKTLESEIFIFINYQFLLFCHHKF